MKEQETKWEESAKGSEREDEMRWWMERKEGGWWVEWEKKSRPSRVVGVFGDEKVGTHVEEL